jgi:hypothetical protein
MRKASQPRGGASRNRLRRGHCSKSAATPVQRMIEIANNKAMAINEWSDASALAAEGAL